MCKTGTGPKSMQHPAVMKCPNTTVSLDAGKESPKKLSEVKTFHNQNNKKIFEEHKSWYSKVQIHSRKENFTFKQN